MRAQRGAIRCTHQNSTAAGPDRYRCQGLQVGQRAGLDRPTIKL
ncbi:hypothetical protein [Lysobacter gummosus]